MLLIFSVLHIEEQIDAFFFFFYEPMSDFARVLVVKECCWAVDVAAVGDLK